MSAILDENRESASVWLKNHSEAMKRLSYREREIIKMRFGLSDGYNYTLEEVGWVFKVTRERIRQIEKKALARLDSEATPDGTAGM